MNSIMKKMRELLKDKKLAQRIQEADEIAKAAADKAEKERLNSHRIATKQARIDGSEPPPPLEEKAVEPEPVVEKAEPVEEAAPKKPAAKKAPAKKKPAKKTTKKEK